MWKRFAAASVTVLALAACGTTPQGNGADAALNVSPAAVETSQPTAAPEPAERDIEQVRAEKKTREAFEFAVYRNLAQTMGEKKASKYLEQAGDTVLQSGTILCQVVATSGSEADALTWAVQSAHFDADYAKALLSAATADGSLCPNG